MTIPLWHGKALNVAADADKSVSDCFAISHCSCFLFSLVARPNIVLPKYPKSKSPKLVEGGFRLLINL